MNQAVLAALISLLGTGALVPLLVRFAVGRDLLDVPNLRSSHETPTPRLGGVAVVAGTWVGVLAFGLTEYWPLLVGATLVGVVGLADDLRGLHFGPKAAAQAVVAIALLLLWPPAVVSGATLAVGAAVFVVGVFWVVALTNAFNFMDGIDGITGGVALVAGLSLAALGGVGFLPALVGACGGFLIWNINPASTFMGDAGSYFLGFALAVAALYAPVGGGWSLLPFYSCILVFTPYLFDTAWTILRRLRRGAGAGIFSAHREHIYQRITPETSMHRRTSNLYYGLAVVAGLAGILASRGGVYVLFGTILALLCCALMLLLARFLSE